MWALGLGATLAVAGVAFDVAPAIIVAIGAATAVANMVHAKRRGYCPIPNLRDAHPRAAIDPPTRRPDH
jgi:hypothetical protein